MSNEVITLDADAEIVMTESEKVFATQVLKDVNSTFDLATTVMAIKRQISIPDDCPVGVTGTDIMQFMGLARAMHLNPIMGGIYGFKDRKSGRLTLGVSKKGWQQALESQPDYAGLTWIEPEMQEKKISDGRNTTTILYYPWVTCVVKKILKNGQIGEFEGRAYFDEEFDVAKPTWRQKNKRMMETRALTIAASNAYGWGAYDPDEISAIAEPQAAPQPPITATATVIEDNPKTLLLTQINRAGSYNDIVKFFKAASPELQHDQEVINACKTARAELEKI